MEDAPRFGWNLLTCATLMNSTDRAFTAQKRIEREMSPTPTPEIPAMPDDLRGMTPELMARVDAALHDYAAQADGNLDALLGIGVTSPWIPFAWTALAVITAVAIAALAVTVWKERRVGGVGNEIRLRRQTNAEKKAETAAARVAKSTREGFTFTPADTEDLPDPPVNLDEETRP